MNKPIALVDLDGTLAGYDAAMVRDLKKVCPPEFMGQLISTYRSKDWPEWFESLTRMIRHQPGWWRDLEPLADGFVILSMLQKLGFEAHVLTKGPRTTIPAWSEKVEWCANNLTDETLVTIASRKEMVYGRVLFDDSIAYTSEWLLARPRGLVIMPCRPWNRDFKHDRVVRWDGTNKEEVRQALIRARDRRDGEPL